MKNLIISFVLLFLAATMFGQYVNTSEMAMTRGTFPAYTVTIAGVDGKTVEKEWQQFMKEYSGKSKRDRKSGEITTSGVAIGGIGGNANVYSTSVELGSNVQHTAWFESDEMYVSDAESAQSDVAVGIMERFIVYMKRVRIEEELEAEADALKNLQKDLNQEEKNEERQHDDIAKYEKKIQEAEAEISESKNLQKQKIQEIEAQQKVIEAVKVRLNGVGLEDEVEAEMEDMMEKGKKGKANKDSNDR
jgi:hypothetical protein